MKIKIDKNNFETLIRGASIFTTGGGIMIPDQMKTLKGLDLSVEIYSLDEFDEKSFLCTVGELGPTDAPPLKKDKIIKKMLKLIEQKTGKNIVGLFPPEIGQESVVLESSQLLKLPIADFDPTGFRAVPYFDVNIFNVKNIDFQLTPIVVANDNGDISVIEGNIRYKEVENKLREMSTRSESGIIFLMGMTISIKKLLENGITGPSYSRALEIGLIKTQTKLFKKLKAKKIIRGKVIDKITVEKKGFLAEKIKIKDDSWNLYTLIMLNEAIFLLDETGKIIASVPERILLLDGEKAQGLSGVFLNINTPVTIAIIDPSKEWRNKNSKNIFGKKRFEELLK